MDKNTNEPEATARVRAAQDARDRRAAHYDAASGSPGELSAITELQAAERELAARKAWLDWIDREY